MNRPGTSEAGDDLCPCGRPDHQELVRLLREALGMPGPPLPITPKAAFDEALAEARRLRDVETAARKVCRYYERVDKDRMSPSLAGLIEHLADVLGEGERTRDGSEHRPG